MRRRISNRSGFGKQLDVYTFSRVAVAFRIADLPHGVTWLQIYGIGILAGIGLTMSLFISTLAFEQPGSILVSNLSIVIGSSLSAFVGYFVLSKS